MYPLRKREANRGVPNPKGYRNGSTRERRPSLDQFDPRQGYTRTNTRIICFKCNRIKNSGDAKYHDDISKYIKANGPFDIVDDAIHHVYTLAEYAAKDVAS